MLGAIDAGKCAQLEYSVIGDESDGSHFVNDLRHPFCLKIVSPVSGLGLAEPSKN